MYDGLAPFFKYDVIQEWISVLAKLVNADGWGSLSFIQDLPLLTPASLFLPWSKVSVQTRGPPLSPLHVAFISTQFPAQMTSPPHCGIHFPVIVWWSTLLQTGTLR